MYTDMQCDERDAGAAMPMAGLRFRRFAHHVRVYGGVSLGSPIENLGLT